MKMSEIKVISGDLDGSQLRQEKRRSGRYLLCDGTGDDVQINEAIQAAGKSIWSLPAGAWERIFGSKK